MTRCLYCYRPLTALEKDYHSTCSRKIFDTKMPPELPFNAESLESMAGKILGTHTSVTGVQPKLSLHISPKMPGHEQKRFTIVGLWGGYILKPPTEWYPHLPEMEDLTMHLAQLARIKTAPHCLIRMGSGELAYITKRMDRSSHGKLAMEDMCQLTERLTENKYHGSYEQIGKAIMHYSATPGLDLINFMELVLFSFITGNADMHLKNFALLDQPGLGMTLAPAYDLLNTTLINPSDQEEMALTLHGKKRKLTRKDFIEAMHTLNINIKQQESIVRKMINALPLWVEMIDQSFLNPYFKERYIALIQERLARLH